jgi:type VII secretion-associated serine protease mycosin
VTRRGTRAVVALVVVAASVVFAPLPTQAAPAERGDKVRDSEYWLDAYGIRDAWSTTRGAGITIAVIDTGVDGTAPELVGAVVAGGDFSGLGSSNGQTPVGADGSEHGTMVASLAAGRGTGGNNGVIGSAPEASIMPLSIGFGAGATDSDAQIAKAVRYAVDHGAKVINMSLTRNTLDWPQSWDDAFLYAMQHNVVVVAAAGNRGSGTTEVGAPATMPGVLTVAGVDSAGKASFDASAQGITIGVTAPSEKLVAVVPGGQHVLWNGTSGAAPIVSGVVALVMAAHPELDANNVINRIVATARDAGAPGADPIYGFGLIDAAAAVRDSVSRVTENPMGDLAQWITVYRRAPATAAPVPVIQPSATPAPIAAAPESPLGTLLPTVNLLRNVGIPLGVVVAFAALAVWAIVRAVRQFGAARKTR